MGLGEHVNEGKKNEGNWGRSTGNIGKSRFFLGKRFRALGVSMEIPI